MDNTSIFIEKYKELEEAVRSTYNLRDSDSISHYLKNRNEFRHYADEISYCQQVRNFIVHERKLSDSFAVIPSDEMLKFIDMLIAKIKNRRRCIDACIKLKNVYHCSLGDKVKPAIKAMREGFFTHIPILQNGRVVGVFDENSLFNYVADHETVDVDSNLRFSDIADYLSLTDRDNEAFIFIKSSMYIDEVEDIFQRNFNQRERIGVAFITNNGRPDEQLQGLITPWDILANN